MVRVETQGRRSAKAKRVLETVSMAYLTEKANEYVVEGDGKVDARVRCRAGRGGLKVSRYRTRYRNVQL